MAEKRRATPRKVARRSSAAQAETRSVDAGGALALVVMHGEVRVSALELARLVVAADVLIPVGSHLFAARSLELQGEQVRLELALAEEASR